MGRMSLKNRKMVVLTFNLTKKTIHISILIPVSMSKILKTNKKEEKFGSLKPRQTNNHSHLNKKFLHFNTPNIVIIPKIMAKITHILLLGQSKPKIKILPHQRLPKAKTTKFWMAKSP